MRITPRPRSSASPVSYETEVVDVELRDGRFVSATVARHGAEHRIAAKCVVVACGGFESNLAWLREAWGPPADNFIVRGTPHNMGRVLKVLLAKGAKQVSDATQGHCVAIDARSPSTTAASSRAWTRSRSASW
jgi:tricarballylate dehydrogenase